MGFTKRKEPGTKGITAEGTFSANYQGDRWSPNKKSSTTTQGRSVTQLVTAVVLEVPMATTSQDGTRLPTVIRCGLFRELKPDMFVPAHCQYARARDARPVGYLSRFTAAVPAGYDLRKSWETMERAREELYLAGATIGG